MGNNDTINEKEGDPLSFFFIHLFNERSVNMTYTIIIIVSILIVLGIAAAFGFAVNSGYNYKHTVDPLPDNEDNNPEHKTENEAPKS